MSYKRNYNEIIDVQYFSSLAFTTEIKNNNDVYLSVAHKNNLQKVKIENNNGVWYLELEGITQETVNINIEVDTLVFDHSVYDCNTSVNLLTGAVVASETAQISSIDTNSKKLAETIVVGFFSYIRSEISQKIMELTQKIDSHLLHLRELTKTCIGKQKQMEGDYNRISSRYYKIFTDLNKELENRIFELDKPSFLFKKGIDSHIGRTTENDLVNTVTIFGKENSELHVKISSSIAKKSALNAINRANVFLIKQKILQNTINKNMHKEKRALTFFIPVCFIETIDKMNQLNNLVYQVDFLPKNHQNMLVENFIKLPWVNSIKKQQEKVNDYFNSEVNIVYKTNNNHDERVKAMIAKIFNLNSIKFV